MTLRCHSGPRHLNARASVLHVLSQRRLIRDSIKFRVFSQSHTFTISTNKDISSRIARLFCRCCPPAITRRVTLFVVYTVERMSAARPRPEVLKKPLKVLPFGAHTYPSPPPQVELGIRRVPATVFHRRPCAILWRARLAMGSTRQRSPRFLCASAARGVPSPQIRAQYDGITAATAFALPSRLSTLRVKKAGDSQFAKHFPIEINHFHAVLLTEAGGYV